MNKNPSRNDKTNAWPFVRWIERRNRWQVDARTKNGGERRFFETKAEATGFAAACLIKRTNQGSSAFDDSELAVYGLSVADAVKFTIDHYRRKAASAPLDSAVEALIEAKRGAGRSERYCSDLRSRLGKLCAAFESRPIAHISTADLECFLTGLNVAAETRNTFRRNIRTLWGFAEKRGWANVAMVKNTERARVIAQPPGILSPEQAAALLAESKDDDLLAFHAVGVFAGLRVAEIKKLNWRDVDLSGGFIHVAAEISKTRARRLVPIPDNLTKWLQPVAKPSGPIVGPNLRRRHEAARKRAGITEWPDNCMRHSFVSYRLAASGNAAQTALESGHDQAVLFKHYRELVRPKDAERFFSIRPADNGAAERIVSISAA